jgi:hypothetical protein
MADDTLLETKADPTKETTPTFTCRNNQTGLLEVRHALTGDLLGVQKSMDTNILYAKEKMATMVKVNGRELLLEPGVTADMVDQRRLRQWVYSEVIGETICQMIIEGWAIHKICKEPGFPTISILSTWRRENSSFEEMIRQAFRERGEYHRDKVLEIAEKNEDAATDEIGGAKLAIDSHKWLAQTDNHERFGLKTKVDLDAKITARFVIDTGIRRPEDPGYQKDQTRIAQDNQKPVLEIVKGEEKK